MTNEHIIVLDKFRLDNPALGREGLVHMFSKRFPTLSQGDVWIIVTRYTNERNLCLPANGEKSDGQMKTTGKSKSLFATLTNFLR